MTRDDFASACRFQAGWCEKLGSPIYQSILLALAEDVEGAGRAWPQLAPFAQDAGRTLLPLRFLAGVHRMVLTGELPELARYYPSAGGTAESSGAAEAFLRAAETHTIAIPERVQTNEIQRCCALLPGLLEIARRARLPLRLLEIGCSAGLNLRWDRYRYATPAGTWGEADSPVEFANVYAGEAAGMREGMGDARVTIAERRGCDLNPIDPTSANGRLDLLSFVWPGQSERFRLLDRAIELARRVPARVDRESAAEWLTARLAEPAEGAVTVVFHSIVMLYLTPEQRAEVAEIVRAAGERATAEAPLARLAMENGGEEAEVSLEYWPGGERRLIAEAGFHGRNVRLK